MMYEIILSVMVRFVRFAIRDKSRGQPLTRRRLEIIKPYRAGRPYLRRDRKIVGGNSSAAAPLGGVIRHCFSDFHILRAGRARYYWLVVHKFGLVPQFPGTDKNLPPARGRKGSYLSLIYFYCIAATQFWRGRTDPPSDGIISLKNKHIAKSNTTTCTYTHIRS